MVATFIHITKVKAKIMLNIKQAGYSGFEQIDFLACFMSVPHKILLQYSPLPLRIAHCELKSNK